MEKPGTSYNRARTEAGAACFGRRAPIVPLTRPDTTRTLLAWLPPLALRCPHLHDRAPTPPFQQAATLKDEKSDSIYLARIRRDVVDIKDHVERIEEEILEEMSAALGRTAGRCDYKFFMLDKAKEAVDGCGHDQTQRRAAIEAFNAARQEAEKARRALLIHRQAVGFRTQNYQEVSKFWPLPEKMEEGEAGATAGAEGDGEAAGKAGAEGEDGFRRGKGGVHLTHEGQLSWADQMSRLYSRRG